ncbi:MFS transporter [Streptomyces sp. NPDC046805]|uniref:MFS transporter n=1 Tax=Streptomyces sp. NPDC046805 TaxID=3155134 RepID=UPI00340685CD
MSAELITRGTGVAPKRSVTGLIILLTAICVADGFDLTVFAAALPVLLKTQKWGITAVSAGNVASIQMVGLLVGALVSGYLGDRFGRRNTAIGNLVVFSVFTGLVAVAPNLAVVAALRFLGGLGLGGIIPVLIALVAEYSPADRRYLNNTIMLAGTGVGAFLAPLSGALLLSHADIRWLFAEGGFVALLVLVPLAVLFLPESAHFLRARGRTDDADRLADRYGLTGTPDEESHPHEAKVRIRSLFTGPLLLRTLAILIAEFFVFGIALGFLTTWLPQYLVLGGFQISSALVFSTVTGIAMVVGGVLGGMLQDRLGAKPVVIGYSLLGSVGLLVLGFALQAPAVIYVVVFVLGFANMLYLIHGLVANSYPAEARSTMLGLAFGVGRVGAIVATLAGGWLVAAHLEPRWNFWAWIVPMLVPALALAFVRVDRTVAARSAESARAEVQTQS